MGNLDYNGEMPNVYTGWNIYALNNVHCPDKSIVKTYYR